MEPAHTHTDHLVFRSLLENTLLCFRRTLGHQNIRIRFSNTDEARLIVAGASSMTLPRGYLKFTSYEVPRTINSWAMARFGIYAAKSDGHTMTLAEAKVQPVELRGDFHWLTDSGPQALEMVDTLSYLSQSKAMTFGLELGDVFRYQAYIQLGESVVFDEADFLSEDKKGVFDVNIPFSVRGHTGRIKRRTQVLAVTTTYRPAPQARSLHELASQMYEDADANPDH